MPSYRYYLLSDVNAIVGRGDFQSPDDEAAIAVAQLVSAAGTDHALSYELWRQEDRISVGKPSAAMPSRAAFDPHIQQATVDVEVALHDSLWQIAESRRLLEAIQTCSS